MKSRILLTAIVVLALITASVQVYAAPMIMQATPEIRVVNPLTGDSDFIFATSDPLGTRFNATAEVHDATDLFAYQVYVSVNDTLLNITRAWLPHWDPGWVFAGKSTVRPNPAFYDFDTDGYLESAKVGDSMLMGDPFTGSGLLAIIEFEVVYVPAQGKVSCNLTIDSTDTYLLNYDLDEVPVTKTGGYYEYVGPAGPEPPHAEFTYSPATPYIGTTITFDASDSTPNGGELTSYTWDFGDGSLPSTESDPVTTHAYVTNGTFTVTLTVLDTEGLNDTAMQPVTVLTEPEIDVDLNDDRKVDITDIAIVALAFGSYPGHERWNEPADVNKDEMVCMKDIVLVALNFGAVL